MIRTTNKMYYIFNTLWLSPVARPDFPALTMYTTYYAISFSTCNMYMYIIMLEHVVGFRFYTKKWYIFLLNTCTDRLNASTIDGCYFYGFPSEGSWY